MPPDPSSPPRVGRSDGRARRAADATARGARRAGATTGRAASYTLRQARRATHAEGAGDSGLSRLIELHAFNGAGDAAVAISLAGTLFFQVPTDQARGQVALFLGLTMLPFAIVAPLIGPVLDRFSHGRRWAIGATMALRAFLCWVLADAVRTGDTVALFPAALGCLVASKAYGVTRAAAVPRLLPRRADPGQGELPDLAGRRRRGGDLGPAGRRRVDLRAAVVAALRVPGLHRGDRAGDPAPLAGGQRRRRGQAVAVRPGPAAAQASRLPPGVVVALRSTWGCGCSAAS